MTIDKNEKPKKSWLQISFEVDSSQEDMASWLMMQLGANGCQVISTPVNGKVLLEASFPENGSKQNVEQKLTQINSNLDEYGLAYCLSSMQVKTIEEKDWLAEWKKGYVPIPINDTFIICPIWLKDSLSKKDWEKYQIILIDPGMAFGTGYHATTQYCLKVLCEYKDRKNILDVGAGSGILSIALAKLNNSANIVALEIEEDAVRNAGENIALNKVDKQISLIAGSTDVLLKAKDSKTYPATFDVILSNLTCEDIVSLLPDYSELLAPNGVVICAGILKEKLPLLEKALANCKMFIKDHEINGMWAGALVTRVS